jgi:hypothetical protein
MTPLQIRRTAPLLVLMTHKGYTWPAHLMSAPNAGDSAAKNGMDVSNGPCVWQPPLSGRSTVSRVIIGRAATFAGAATRRALDTRYDVPAG